MKISAEGLFAAVIAGVLSGLVILLGTVSQAALVFSGPLEAGLSIGIGGALFAATVISASLAIGSSLKGMIGFPQGVPIAMLALMASGIAAAMPEATGPELAVTALAGVGLATALGGAVFLAMGAFRLGGIIRFIPFPVIAAFLAGSGFLLARGSMDLIVPGDGFAAALQPQGLMKLGLALGFVAVLSWFAQRTHASLALSLAVFGATALFHIIAFIFGADWDALTSSGWLMPPAAEASLWPPIGLDGFVLIDWHAIASQSLTILTLPAIAALALLMNASGMELALRRDIDLDRELMAAGAGNAIAGLGGGSMGYQDLGLTLLAQRIGGSSRVIGIAAALTCAVALVFGGPIVGLVPKPLFGALLLWIGANLILDWAVLTHSQLKRSDYALLILILGVIIAFGPLQGIGLGLLVSLALFALEYARVDLVRARLDGTCFHSSAERSAADRQRLQERGGETLVYRLQGFVFFGTAARLRDEIEERIARAPKGSIRHVLLDFAAVSGVDSSTVMTIIRFERLAQAHGFTLVLTGLDDKALDRLTRGGLTYGADEPCHILPDLDRGMEWCEDRILALGPERDAPAEMMKELEQFLGGRDRAETFAAYLEPVSFEPGMVLCTRGTPADEIYFIESGHARVQADPEDASTRRLRGFGPGTILGELAFFTGAPRPATIRTTTPVKAWRLTRGALARLEAENQPLSALFYRALSAQFAERLSATNRMLKFLVD